LPNLPKGRKKKPTDHNKSWGGDTSFYRTYAWRKLRMVVLRENPLCVHCLGEGFTKEADVVDHIIPVKKWEEGRLDISNLQGLCHSCHNRKTYHENRNYEE
jgi:5-methylcytosine-specific restriction protein A